MFMVFWCIGGWAELADFWRRGRSPPPPADGKGNAERCKEIRFDHSLKRAPFEPTKHDSLQP
jgi:hypothetical protein